MKGQAMQRPGFLIAMQAFRGFLLVLSKGAWRRERSGKIHLLQSSVFLSAARTDRCRTASRNQIMMNPPAQAKRLPENTMRVVNAARKCK